MLRTDDTVLVLVDIQGKLATLMHNKKEFFENVARLIKGVKALEIPIIWNEQLPEKLGRTVPEIKGLLEGLSPLEKNTFSCCGNPDFMEKLRSTRREQILLAGMETHVCVYQTALDLLPEGYEINLVTDAVSSRTLDNKLVALQAMKELGAKLTTVEMALFEMLQVAEGDKFKKIIEIVK
ncbi:MAG: hydrolase [Candidatus Zixiibacteriota bacterium]|nr:MAG: hydrolase [candidate division Zixibacteria bacterium]